MKTNFKILDNPHFTNKQFYLNPAFKIGLPSLMLVEAFRHPISRLHLDSVTPGLHTLPEACLRPTWWVDLHKWGYGRNCLHCLPSASRGHLGE